MLTKACQEKCIILHPLQNLDLRFSTGAKVASKHRTRATEAVNPHAGAQDASIRETCLLQVAVLWAEGFRWEELSHPHAFDLRKRASHTDANECSYKLFILQNRGIFYGVEHWNHSIMNCGNILTAHTHTQAHTYTYTRTHSLCTGLYSCIIQEGALSATLFVKTCSEGCIQDPFPCSLGFQGKEVGQD